MTRRRWTCGIALPAGLLALAGVAGCQHASSSQAASKPAAPAKVELSKESDLATVKLTPEAEAHLGIALVAVERKGLPRTSTYGGEVIVPHGRLVVVSAPFVGDLKAPPGPGLPSP